MLNSLHSVYGVYGVNFNYISKCRILHKIFLKTVVKNCGNDLSNTILVAKGLIKKNG